MDEIKVLGNIAKGHAFIDELKKKNFLFSFVISYTETCEIPGITFAGSQPDLIQYTPPADAEFLHYGYCKIIDKIPMTPDGKPTPALLTKVALESASIPHVVINAGSKIAPKLPFIYTGLEYGKNITQGSAMSNSAVLDAIDSGRIVGRTLASLTDCLIVGESVPGGTTTALAVLRALGINAKVSSSIPQNPVALKEKIVENALNKLKSNDPYSIIAQVGDPMIPFVAGILSSASKIKKVILAGGTQMAAVLAFGKKLGFDEERTAIATTCYITNDKSANFREIIESITNIPILVACPKLENSKFEGLQAYSKGFAKEGVGAGGAMTASILKSGIDFTKLLELTEKEYQRIFT